MTAEVRGMSVDSLKAYAQMVKGFVNNFDDEAKLVWASKQAYIALGNLLTTCALERIDACPMEGFEVEKYSEILGLEAKGLKPLALVAAGYRSEEDKYASHLKVRKPMADLFL